LLAPRPARPKIQAVTSSFLERLHEAARYHRSWLCVGLDPDPALLPPGLGLDDFLRGIVEATSDLVCCYKPNLAFYEAQGLAGQRALRSLLEIIPSGVPVIIDAKRGDTPQTMKAYARAIFDELNADAVTVNPYLGGDSLEPIFCLSRSGRLRTLQNQQPRRGRDPGFARRRC
jgi:orotidine-5'-phosphate decarboxylase